MYLLLSIFSLCSPRWYQFFLNRTEYFYPNTLLMFFLIHWMPPSDSLLTPLPLFCAITLGTNLSLCFQINTRWSPHSKWLITLVMFSATHFETESHEISLSIMLWFPCYYAERWWLPLTDSQCISWRSCTLNLLSLGKSDPCADSAVARLTQACCKTRGMSTFR